MVRPDIICSLEFSVSVSNSVSRKVSSFSGEILQTSDAVSAGTAEYETTTYVFSLWIANRQNLVNIVT